MKFTKIVCTIGPASEKVPTLTSMVKAGMNVARLNFSHGTYENHAMLIKNVRTVSEKLKQPMAIIQDLQGPKIRVGELKNPVAVKAGAEVIIGKDFKIDFPIHSSVKPGERILIQDGLIQLRVKKVKGKEIVCEVLNGGEVKSHKGVNLPETVVKFPIITEKDIKDLKFGLKQDVDYVALSFVRSKKDIANLRKLILENNPRKFELPKIIAKIERKEAIEKIDEIIEASDAIMVARGDMGVELQDDVVPVIQKDIISKCLKAAKPVIVATQMLESMVLNPRPTRAEVSDVANAVIDQTHCVMLSEESAFGKYPIEAVSEMARVIETAEASKYTRAYKIEESGDKKKDWVKALAESAAKLSTDTNVKAIICVTHSGRTVQFLSALRPAIPMYMLTDQPKVCRQLALLWGINPFLVPKYKSVDELLKNAVKAIKSQKLIKAGDAVVVVAGHALGEKVNLVELTTIK